MIPEPMNVNRPKPKPPAKRPEVSESTTTPTSVPSPKKSFVRKPHLTERPFAQNSELKKLRESMPKQTPRKRFNNK